jgi:hypothetical protein
MLKRIELLRKYPSVLALIFAKTGVFHCFLFPMCQISGVSDADCPPDADTADHAIVVFTSPLKMPEIRESESGKG